MNRPNLQNAEQIETNNRFSSLPSDEVEQDNQNTTVSFGKPKRPSKPTPIFLYGIMDLKQLTNCLDEVANHTEYTYKIVTKNELIISTPTAESYKKIISHIRSKGLIGHTFTRKEDRSKKNCYKKLTPHHSPTGNNKSCRRYERGEIVNVTKRGTKDPCNVFFVNLEPSERCEEK